MTNQRTTSYTTALAGLMLYGQQSRSQIETDQATSSSTPLLLQPTASTVVIGKGSIPRRAPGNKKLAALIREKIPAYVNATSKIVKTSIVSDVLFALEDACAGEGNSPPFLRHDECGYRSCNEIAARAKITSSFRDILHHKYKSSSKNKVAKRRLQNKNKIHETRPAVTKEHMEPDLTRSGLSYSISETAPLSSDDTQIISRRDSFAKLCCKILGSPTVELIEFDPFDIEPTPMLEVSDCSTDSSSSCTIEDSSMCSQTGDE